MNASADLGALATFLRAIPAPRSPFRDDPEAIARGELAFGELGCASCHTLQDAGAKGTVGPNLDEQKPDLELVTDRVTHGKGVMPAFGDSGQLTEQQIADVSAYVVQATGG